MNWQPCCCCTIYSQDDFDRASLGAGWSARSGTWSIVANELSTSSSNGLIRNETTTGGSNAHVVKGKFKASGSTDQVRIIAAYTDDNNYLYVQFTISALAATLDFWQVSGGTHAKLGESVTIEAIPADTWVRFQVCYVPESYPEDGWLAVNYTVTGSTQKFWRESANATGAYAGLGTGSISGTVVFDDWVHQQHRVDDSMCPECGGIIDSACIYTLDQKVSGYYLLEVPAASIANGASCGGTPKCDTKLVGSFVLETTVADKCRAADLFPSRVFCSTSFTETVSLVFSAGTNPGTYKIRLTWAFGGTGNPHIIWEKDNLADPPDARNLVDFQLDYVSTTGNICSGVAGEPVYITSL